MMRALDVPLSRRANKKLTPKIIFLLSFGFLAPEAAAAAKVKFSNLLSLQPSYYLADVGQGTSQWSTVIRDEPELSWKSASGIKFKLAPWLYADPVAKSAIENAVVDFNEANLDWRPGDWTIQIGLNRVSWGVTDFYNPLDVASARRYLDPLNSEKRAVPSLDVSWEANAWRVEGIYVPVQQESLMPGENSRWLPRDVYLQRQFERFTLDLAPRFRYSYAGARVIDGALNHNFGTRVEYRGSGFDLTAVFFQGAPTAPAIDTPEVNTYTDPNDINHILADHIQLRPTYYLRRTAGLGVVWTLDTMIVRFAAADSARLSENSALPGWSNGAVLGLEKNFSIAASTLTLLLQATYAESEEQSGNTVTSLERIFDRAYLLGLRLATSGAWTFSGASLFDNRQQGWFALAKAECKVTDGVTTSLQIDWLDGAPATPLGTYRRNRRVTLLTSLYF